MSRLLPAVGIAVLALAAVVAEASALHASGVLQVCRRIHADAVWPPTGVLVAPGDRVCVEAHGTWSHGAEADDTTHFYGPQGDIANPDGTRQPIISWEYARLGMLIGRIGDDPADIAFPIAERRCFVAARGGELLLGINDSEDGFDDNEGVMIARISVRRTAAAGELILASAGSNGVGSQPSAEGRCFK